MKESESMRQEALKRIMAMAILGTQRGFAHERI
jgi:hypothetical protein